MYVWILSGADTEDDGERHWGDRAVRGADIATGAAVAGERGVPEAGGGAAGAAAGDAGGAGGSKDGGWVRGAGEGSDHIQHGAEQRAGTHWVSRGPTTDERGVDAGAAGAVCGGECVDAAAGGRGGCGAGRAWGGRAECVGAVCGLDAGEWGGEGTQGGDAGANAIRKSVTKSFINAIGAVSPEDGPRQGASVRRWDYLFSSEMERPRRRW